MKILPVSLIFFAVAERISGAVYERFSDLPTRQFDFVIVGGGTAGNVVANRLTEISNISVLVLEAGGSPEGVLPYHVPGLALSLVNSPLDWNYTAKVGPGNQTAHFPSGFALGGGSSINWMAYTRGSSEDWDRYAAVTGDEGWSWSSMQTYIRKNERMAPPTDHHNTSGEWDPAIHGHSGINSVSLSGFPFELGKRTVQVSKSTGPDDEFKFNLDYNSGNQLGFGWAQCTIRDGERSSSASSYLATKYINRPNLHVLLHAHVSRILPINKGQGEAVFSVVELTQDEGETFQQVSAAREIVLSAGAIGTPHILLNSGIGESNTLSSIGLETVYHLPSVGQNLTDHPALGNVWLVNATDTSEVYLDNPKYLEQWNETRTGPLVGSVVLAFGWFRLPRNVSVLQGGDPAAGPNTPHYELLMLNGNPGSLPGSPPSIAIGTYVVSPTSRGSVTLASSNPLDPPTIDTNFYSTDFDLDVMREAVRTSQRFMSSDLWDGFEFKPAFDVDTDDKLDAHILGNIQFGAHAVGTASMSPKGATWGVVDPDLLVKGIQGVRVVDASVMPFVPAAHTQAPTYMIAERGADLIKTRWALCCDQVG